MLLKAVRQCNQGGCSTANQRKDSLFRARIACNGVAAPLRHPMLARALNSIPSHFKLPKILLREHLRYGIIENRESFQNTRKNAIHKSVGACIIISKRS